MTLAVKSIKRKKLDNKIAVYDIEVKKYNNFCLENGSVVHNSKDLADSVAGSIYNAKAKMAEMRANMTSKDLIDGLNNRLKPQNIYHDLLNQMGLFDPHKTK